ncbi:putative leucine-rich repeat domain, L domain-containing protein [Lupinus albus]|uniref:Putative leucine-rich repeat domain, L domain-containing protein n=1 Tax=Lupinus albus TaxID=3870 RepID=A0A6A4Q1T6_LUPAL|nr:putative leucine-rich repeat domain, L domain-containing protein [Lupinus albus]
MAIVTGDRYLDKLVKFVDEQAGLLIDGVLVLKLNPAGLHYMQSRLEALYELESLLTGAPVDYLRAYVSDLGDHRALEQLRRILRLLTSLKVVSVLPPQIRDPTPLSFLPFGRLKVLELRGCDLSTSAARGLLELRHTLEKIVCHNSTDALRHVFASRITEIKDSPQWNRLSFVSCACNGLVLMDESLQLLPAVETLDLSRNKFAKVDNLNKCMKLKHLDLGFNHLRTLAPFSQVSYHIVKLVLRNNALSTLRGIENLKSLEGLDVSYNIISNFSELEFLASLTNLQALWLEGNPLCCARWYRAQVFSFFSCPEKLKLDAKEISTIDFWKRQIIIASMQKQPTSFGIYVPAKDEAIVEGSNERRRPRLACIESEEGITSICSDEEPVSCTNDIQNREDHDLSNEEAEVEGLINKIEQMKKERSILWLREFKDWMDITSDKSVVTNEEDRAALHHLKENYIRNETNQEQHGEVSRYVSDSVLASGDDSSMNILEPDSSFVDMSASSHRQQNFDHRVLLGNAGGASHSDSGGADVGHLKPLSLEGISSSPSHFKSYHSDTSAIHGAHGMAGNMDISPLTTVCDIFGSQSSSACPTSPPHFQKDLFHRRQHLVEEVLQLSAGSFSMASSDSNTSCSEVDYTEFESSVPEVDNFPCKNYVNGSVHGHISQNHLKDKFNNPSQGVLHAIENGLCLFSSTTDQTSRHASFDVAAAADNGQRAFFVSQDADFMKKRKRKIKAKKRVISILEENPDCNACDHEREQISQGEISIDSKRELGVDEFPEGNHSTQENDDFIVTYFNMYIADFEASEICSHCIRCNFVLQREMIYKEREVAVLLSSHKKLYVLLINVDSDGSGNLLSLLNCHKLEEVCEVLVGMGLQVLRVNFESGEAYLFVTKSIEKSREILCTILMFDSCGGDDRFSIRSLEQVQVELFDNQICGGSNVSIYQYAMVLVCYNNGSDQPWFSRSLFVIGGYVLLCIEDVKQLYSFSTDASVSPYFRLDSCCSIADITEMVTEVRDNSCCVTLTIRNLMPEFHPSTRTNLEPVNHGNTAPGSIKLKIQWYSKDNLLKFVSLMKAIHAEKPVSPLVVRCIS